MPDYIVTNPEGKKFRVTAPEGATQDQILSYAKQQFSQPQEKPVTALERATALPAGVNQGVAGIAGIPMDALLGLGNLSSAGMGYLQSKITGNAPSSIFDPANPESVPFTSSWLTKQLNKIPGNPAEVPRPDDMASRYIAAAGQALPAAISAQPTNLRTAAQAFIPTQAAAAAGQTVDEVSPNNPLAKASAMMLAQGVTNAGINRIFPERPVVPSKDELKQQAGAAYKKAEETGTVITSNSFAGAKQRIASMLDKEGIDPTLHPDTTAALKRITSTEGPVTLEKLEQLRRIAQNAEGSIKPSDQRLAAKTVDAIDDFMDELKPSDLASGSTESASQLNQARDLWKRGRKADVIDELVRRAELSAPNFSASGKENALRTEFRALAKNERRFKLFTQDEQAAINKVAKGGPVENSLRMLGKFAPTGVVSTGASTGLGWLIGGPAGAAGLPAIGGASRYLAKQMTTNNANAVSDLVRSGGRAPQLPPMSPELLRAYLIQLQQAK